MSDPGFSFDEETLSPDIFNDVDTVTNNPVNSDDSSSMSIDVNGPEPLDDVPEWKGVSMDEIRKGLGVYDSQELPPICPSPSHIVLISLPLPARGTPKPYPTHQVEKWCQDYVRMPHSKRSVYPIDENGSRRCRNRWEIIQESLLQSFVSTHQLENAILSYNHTYAQRWDFTALHHFFSEVLDEDETNNFFETLMPKMVQLALQLPVLVTGSVPLLKRHTNGTISLSQLQIASLLANAFFCTFPRRNSTNPQSEYGRYPYINFNRLFSAYKEEKWNKYESVMEKMKCIFHYFRRVTSKAPEGVVTIQRRYIPKSDCPKWDEQVQKLLPLHTTSKGTIEAEGTGFLQVDFANRYVGGGVLGLGCVQEEIRFVICPELMVTMLITEELDDTEALIISGIERYSKYKGYSNSFKWMGDYVDETPKDSSGRRLTSIVAIDALYFTHSEAQFNINNIIRELNKAYVGFVRCEGSKNNLPPIATGNWGCGAFRGNPKLKVLLQLMAAAVAGRSMVYFTFGDTNLRDDIAEIYMHFVKHETNIAHIFSLLVQYQEFASTRNSDFYRFLYNRSKIKPITQHFNKNIHTKISTAKEVFRKSKCVNNGEKRLFHLDVKKHPQIEEEKIQDWLTNVDEDGIDKKKTEILKEEYVDVKRTVEKEQIQGKDNIKKKEGQIHDRDSTEKKKKSSLWKLLEDTAQAKTIQEHRLSGLELLDSKQELISQYLDNGCSKSTKDESLQSIPISTDSHNVQESTQTLSEISVPSYKHESPIKKVGQRKISDFFQSTS
ncbi:poly(ADP-ribose) glycohydrolase-like isoform X1 [Bombus affinis]|uniref:poly(ADP-ribose) glycohydrolase-like isoform X1 n=2 Tax=Bombus affinis TaxID=309941 RepID=UPI0021B83C9B|nr:poly(ADP-ribose) glycohydrolase-like isoform X1 [Bombus affinis]XP_050589130.1 poly(ADP-ribose) glycohydrolase-like isoform X1 [Bombus affinis]XP_050589131.1 poly(ADP-ribose) glycohydrolase-like isoform X1 [Bombus affinis]